MRNNDGAQHLKREAIIEHEGGPFGSVLFVLHYVYDSCADQQFIQGWKPVIGHFFFALPPDFLRLPFCFGGFM